MRVVVVTQLAADLDSRTYRHAASIARMGHDTVLVEGEGSRALPSDVPFRVIRAGPLRQPTTQLPAPPSPPDPSSARRQQGGPTRPRWHPLELVPLRIRMLPVTVRVGIRRFRQAMRVLIDQLRANLRLLRVLPAADLYWFSGYVPSLAVSVAAGLRRKPFVYDASDSYFEGYRERPPEEYPLNVRVMERLEAGAVRRAAAFVTACEGYRGLLHERHGRVAEVLRNKHDTRLDEPADGDVRSALGIPVGDVVCVQIGNVKTGTATEELLRAMVELGPGHHLVFLGQQQGVVPHLIEALGLEGRAHLLAPVPFTQLAGFLRSADASVILQRPLDRNYEHQEPLRLYHSVAAGLPILYAPLPGIEPVIAEHRLGVSVDPDRPESIAAGVRTLAGEPARSELRSNVARAAPELSWEREETLLANLLTAQGNGRSALAANPGNGRTPLR